MNGADCIKDGWLDKKQVGDIAYIDNCLLFVSKNTNWSQFQCNEIIGVLKGQYEIMARHEATMKSKGYFTGLSMFSPLGSVIQAAALLTFDLQSEKQFFQDGILSP